LRAGFRIGVSSNSHKAINKALEEIEKHAAEQRFSFVGVKRASKDDPETTFNGPNITTVYKSEEVITTHRLVGGTVFHFSREDQRQTYDYLFVDEAGQVSLGNLVAMGGCTRNIVLVGDQMQLPQPVQGVHPGESGLSSLEYLLEDRATTKSYAVVLERGTTTRGSRLNAKSKTTYTTDTAFLGYKKEGERNLRVL
jgi:hypothetical protein